MTLETRFTRLVGCDVPLQLAGMGIVGTPALAAAVSNAGGLGMIGIGMQPLPDRLDDLAARTGKPVGVNFLGPFLNPAEIEIAAGRVRVVELFWDQPDENLVGRVHRGGALASWQVGSVDEARAARDAGCDLVVAQGVEAGGHVRGTVGLLPLLDAVLNAIGDDVPVVAAGGIGSARAVAATLAAGADAVRVGTRFVASEEANAHSDYKAALIAASATDTVLQEEFGRETGWPDAPNRVLRSSFERAERAGGPVGTMGPVPVERFSTLPPTPDCKGDIQAMAMYAGQSVGAVADIKPAADIVAELMASPPSRLER